MSDINYSAKLRELSKKYYQNHIQMEEYRTQRKIIIDKIDVEFNGAKIAEPDNDSSTENNVQSSAFINTVAFFKNNDIDD